MRFSTTFHLHAEPAVVYAHLMDPRHYVGLAPLVVAVHDIRQVGEAVEYVAVERFRLGPLRWHNPIRVRMIGLPAEHRVISSVVSPGRVTLHAAVTLTPATGGGCDATEDVAVRAPWFLRGFVRAKAGEAAAGRAEELARRFPDQRGPDQKG